MAYNHFPLFSLTQSCNIEYYGHMNAECCTFVKYVHGLLKQLAYSRKRLYYFHIFKNQFVYTGRFIMFSVITNIYNTERLCRTLHTVVFDIDGSLAAVHVDFFGLCRKLARTLSTSSSAVNGRLHTLASPSGRNLNYVEKQFTGGKKNLSWSFYLYRFRKYVSYGFPIINCCNPGVNYETPCIF
jgi:hypothetical protein